MAARSKSEPGVKPPRVRDEQPPREPPKIVVAGPIANVHVGGAYRGSSSMQAQGPNGTIGTFVSDGSLFGTLEAVVQVAKTIHPEAF